MLALELSHITKEFPGIKANDNIDFSVEEGHIHCLLGENGAGKSTLMKVLFGLYQPDEGEIRVRGETIHDMHPNKAYNLGIGMVHQQFMLIDDLTVLENIILGDEPGAGLQIDYKLAAEKLTRLSEEYGFALRLNAKISELSVGEKQRVEIMKTLYRGADIIILDEPTAVLTPLETKQLLNIMSDMRLQKKTLIFITHKLNETMAVSDRITVLRRGKSIATLDVGDTSANELARLMVGDGVSFETKKDEAKVEPGKKNVLEFRNVRLMPHAERTVSFEVRPGEILGIAGVDGNGQQELEEMVVGIRPCKEGEIFFSGENVTREHVRERKKRGLGYIPSDRWKHASVLPFSLQDNYLLGCQYRPDHNRGGFILYKNLAKKSERLMQEFDVRAVDLNQKFESLSGGNQQKLVLGREVEHNPELMLACQPTRGLDVGAQVFIKNTLLRMRAEGKGVLFIAADLSELFDVCDRIAVLYKGELMATKDAGDYTNESISLLMAGKHEEETE